VPHGVLEQPVLGQPAGGSGVPLGDPAGLPRTQRVGEEVVIAVPAALVVERDDEQARARASRASPDRRRGR
jgi:hypothetical protein